ncbi:hypothetical protein PIB30_042877 [Stylosanthes scabra]|uniref:Uncharacterized protein n=1 Tax=Stylosanthes scabra TaxID=79078 RepID=A0ABU6ZE44_9FABA|nr:hypothetical protein [Stylosanthes scabra]
MLGLDLGMVLDSLPHLGVVSGESPRLGVVRAWIGRALGPGPRLGHAGARIGRGRFQRHFSRVFSGPKPILKHRLLYIDTKPRMLTFKRDWNCIVWSSVTRLIPTLVHRGQVDSTLKSLLLQASSIFFEENRKAIQTFHHLSGGELHFSRRINREGDHSNLLTVSLGSYFNPRWTTELRGTTPLLPSLKDSEKTSLVPPGRKQG